MRSINMTKKPYETPKLVIHGTLTKLTGGSKSEGADGKNNKKTTD